MIRRPINPTTFEWFRNLVMTAVYIIRFGFSLLTGFDVPMEPLIAICLLLLGAAALVEAGPAGDTPVRALRAVIASAIAFWLAYGFMLTAPQLWWLNAGIPMFFGSAPVVAIDGLVNHDARVAWGGRRFDEFLRRANVANIADEQAALDHGLRFMQRRPHLERLASYPLTGWPTGERVLWRVSWPDSRPE